MSRLALAQLVEARLILASLLTVYVGEVPGQPPTIPGQSRVKPYAVLFSGDGTPIGDTPLTGDPTGALSWPFTVTCAAGYHADAVNVIDTVHGLLDGWVPTLAGYQFGPVTQPPGFDAGPVRRDPATEPPRFFLPLQFLLTAHRIA